MKVKRKVLILILLLVLAISGCRAKEDIKEDLVESISEEEVVDLVDKPVKGGSIYLPLTKVTTLNPLMTKSKYQYLFNNLIYEGLFEFDENLNMVGQLAESYTIEKEGRQINIKLREDVLWHNGTSFTAEDVKFTIDTIKLLPKNSMFVEQVENAMGVFYSQDIKKLIESRIIDDFNISLTFNKKFSNNLEILTFPIICKSEFKGKNPKKEALSLEDYPVIGTGPFRFESYDGSQLTLIANEDYRNGGPYLDRVVGKVYSREEDILRAFKSGELTMATSGASSWEEYKDKELNIVEYTSSDYEFLGFNFKNPIFKDEDGKELRKAIAYGIDRQAIIEKVYFGHGIEVDLPMHPDSWMNDENSKLYGYSKDKSKSIMDEIGQENISLRLLTNTYNTSRFMTAKLIKENLEDIGINVEIINEEAYIKNPTSEDIERQWSEIQEEIRKGNFDMILLGWELSIIPDLSFIFHTNSRNKGTNIINYTNKLVDEELQKTFSSGGSREDKKLAYGELEAIILDDLPYVSLLFKNKALLVDSKLKGSLKPIFNNPYRGLNKVYIPEELQ